MAGISGIYRGYRTEPSRVQRFRSQNTSFPVGIASVRNDARNIIGNVERINGLGNRVFAIAPAEEIDLFAALAAERLMLCILAVNRYQTLTNRTFRGLSHVITS